ncbi:MAG: right-handed parallel beta-helix repeat-containing protein [Desulfitobacteriaceae bacterium]|nr:right-handed parallel beta-helix repeat-containing protein [Desulfitobacteriaceae bacterium]MDD4346183.1 right-handed parallel beta-helix repeat-containing protein [Desulfitobacteriaceae bacterium]MDD4401178.1 right-handed parallel beta-helix repeat-containing protein [Desulfitobacteriaceae bacterium]
MKRKFNRNLAILMVFLICTTLILGNALVASAATTRYVSTTGNDSTGDGTISHPYKTVQKAVNMSNPGDTIYVRGGTYNLTSVTSISGKIGNSSSWLTISSYPGETAYLDGNGSTSNTNCFKIINSQYVKLQNLNIQHFKGAGVWIDGKNYTTSNITLSNLDISNLDPVYSSDGPTMGILGEGPYSSNVTIDSCKIHHIGMLYKRQTDQGIYLNNGVTYWTITNNIINNVADNGIQIQHGTSSKGASNTIIQSNFLCGAQNHGGILIGDNSVSNSVYYNYFYDNHEYDLAMWNHYYHTTNNGHVVRGNYFVSNPANTGHSPSHLEFWDMNIGQSYFYTNTYYLTSVYTSYQAGSCDYPETYLTFSQWKAKGQDTSGSQVADRTSMVNYIQSVIQNYQ